MNKENINQQIKIPGAVGVGKSTKKSEVLYLLNVYRCVVLLRF